MKEAPSHPHWLGREAWQCRTADGPALLAATLAYSYGIAIPPGSALGGMSRVIPVWVDMQGCKVRQWDEATDLVSTISGSTCGFRMVPLYRFNSES